MRLLAIFTLSFRLQPAVRSLQGRSPSRSFSFFRTACGHILPRFTRFERNAEATSSRSYRLSEFERGSLLVYSFSNSILSLLAAFQILRICLKLRKCAASRAASENEFKSIPTNLLRKVAIL